jgi:ATP-dependent RNA helicase RhlE
LKEHTFETLGLDSRLLSAVASDGYTTPTPIQTESIPHILAGRDILGIARTGTGKTAAFALPALQHILEHPATPKPKTTRVLVLAPTRELAAQIAESFASYGKHMQFALTTVFGGVNSKPQERTLARGVDVLCATPGRLLDLHQRGFLNLGGVEYFVLDEADRMFDMGFIHDIRRVVALLPPRRQTLFFSATMPPTIAKLADSMLNNPVKTAVPEGTPTAERVEQLVCFVSKDNKKDLLVHMLKEKNWWRVIVFTRTKHGANRLAKQLCMHDLPADAIHANKSQNNRQRTMAAFKSGDLAVLVATDLAARGIDVDDIELVVNYDLPNEEENLCSPHRPHRARRSWWHGSILLRCTGTQPAA